MHRGHANKLIIVALMITAGILLEIAGLLDAEKMLSIARQYSDKWWLVLILIILQIILFTFALAGSFFLWIVAPLYPPAMATFILTAGGTLGGVCAYLFSKRLTDDWTARIEKSLAYRMLHKHDNFFVLFAMRVLPAFPHSLVNYSSGILRVKLSHFILAAISGLAIKFYIYSLVIYNAASSVSIDDLFDISTYGPLILLSMISLAGVFIKYRLTKND